MQSPLSHITHSAIIDFGEFEAVPLGYDDAEEFDCLEAIRHGHLLNESAAGNAPIIGGHHWN